MRLVSVRALYCLRQDTLPIEALTMVKPTPMADVYASVGDGITAPEGLMRRRSDADASVI